MNLKRSLLLSFPLAVSILTESSYASKDSEQTLANCREILLKVEGAVGVRFSADTNEIKIDPKPAATQERRGFFARLAQVPERIKLQSHVSAVSAAVTQIQESDTPEAHKALAVALAKFFVLEGMTSVKYSSNPDGSYRFKFIKAPADNQSSSRWYSDLSEFLRSNKGYTDPTVLFLDTSWARRPTASFNKDLRTGESNLALVDFPTSDRPNLESYPSANTAHEVFHWFNELLRQKGMVAEPWPSHRIVISETDLASLDTQLFQFKSTPFGKWAWNDASSHYFGKGGYLVEEVGAYAFQSVLESELVTRRANAILGESNAQDSKTSFLNRAMFAASRVEITAQEAIRKYDLHTVFARASLAIYEKALRQMKAGGFGVEVTEDQMITIQLKGGSQIQLLFNRGAKERYAQYHGNPQLLAQDLMLAMAKTMQEAKMMSENLSAISRRVLPVFQYLLKVHGDLPLKGNGLSEHNVMLSQMVKFLEEQAAASTTEATTIYEFPVK